MLWRGVEVDNKQGNSKIPVSKEGIREKGLRGFWGGDGHFWLTGGQGGPEACTRFIRDMPSGEGERGLRARQHKEESRGVAMTGVCLQPDRTGSPVA